MTHHNLPNIITEDILEGRNVYYLNTARLVDEYIFMDDNQAPYVVSTIDKLTDLYLQNSDQTNEEHAEDGYGYNLSGEKQIEYSEEAIRHMKRRYDSLIVPLYKRIFLDASKAKSIFDEHFLGNPDFIENIQNAYADNTWGYTKENPLVWRMYLSSSNSYKDFKCRTAPNASIFECYSSQPYPRFVWVLEIGTISTFAEKKARAEVLLDATSSSNSDTWAILSISYKKHWVFVPHVINRLKEKQISGIAAIKRFDLEEQDYTSINWQRINEEVTQKVLTEIFKSLYYISNNFFGDTYDVFSNSNLKEI